MDRTLPAIIILTIVIRASISISFLRDQLRGKGFNPSALGLEPTPLPTNALRSPVQPPLLVPQNLSRSSCERDPTSTHLEYHLSNLSIRRSSCQSPFCQKELQQVCDGNSRTRPPFLTLTLKKFSTTQPHQPPLHPVSEAEEHGSRKSEGFEIFETESDSTRFVLFDYEERETIHGAEKSGRDKNRFFEKGADANLLFLLLFLFFLSLECERGPFGLGSERGSYRTSARRSIARSSDTP